MENVLSENGNLANARRVIDMIIDRTCIIFPSQSIAVGAEQKWRKRNERGKKMRKAFIERVKRELSVSTRNYTYETNVEEYFDGREFKRILMIKRLSNDDLGTTAALNDWEVVYTEEYNGGTK